MIDDKLRKILDDHQDYCANAERYSKPMLKGELTFVEHIKQAFADEGSRQVQLHAKIRLWSPRGYKDIDKTWTPQVLVANNRLHIAIDAYDRNFIEIEFKNEGDDLMTGQEWYSRFEKEYLALEGQKTGGSALPRTHALQAAMKASGL